MGKEEHHGISVAGNSDSFANRSRPSMAVQPTLGILAQWRDRNDPFDCLDSLVTWVCLTHPMIVLLDSIEDLLKRVKEVSHGRFV